MNESNSNNQKLQSLATEQFFYFFLRLRKGEIRRTVQVLRSRFPDETPDQLARRLISAKSRLSLLGGTLLSLPILVPGIGQALQLAGVVGATSMLTRMHLYLILEIALVFGEDIDDATRVPEMIAVVGATGLGASSPLLVGAFELNPWYSVAAGGLSAGAVTQLIGRTAIGFYKRKLAAQEGSDDQIVASAPLPA
ncbi:MAG: hypothetical protein U9Q81_02895 [Pseudomonadota bacterium]|nr:hypothetical protein [Pseudomonadota bacterium]